MDTKLLTADQLAREIGVSKDTIRDWARGGKIPEIRVSHKIRRFWLPDVVKALRKGWCDDGC